MNTFWNNITKFPKFLISVIIGFFLTTLQPIFELLKNKKKRLFLTILACLLILTFYQIFKGMLGLN
uniref:Uncharacterized protein ycf33 n=1 Tax=Riquetophycus sp. TaxID=1897556 RepID=A0A1C9C8D3_9FLOR|nr:hypothetical protein Riqu_164 [Riquetophycus sp.]